MNEHGLAALTAWEHDGFQGAVSTPTPLPVPFDPDDVALAPEAPGLAVRLEGLLARLRQTRGDALQQHRALDVRHHLAQGAAAILLLGTATRLLAPLGRGAELVVLASAIAVLTADVLARTRQRAAEHAHIANQLASLEIRVRSGAPTHAALGAWEDAHAEILRAPAPE